MIRRAERRDLPEILQMAKALTRHHDDVPRLTAETLERDLFGAPPWFHVLVAEGAAGLQGYAALLPLARLGYGERGMDLHHLFVAESARGQGIGTALIRAAEEMARDFGCGYLIIGTHPDNLKAQAHYQRLGYGPMPNLARRFTRRI